MYACCLVADAGTWARARYGICYATGNEDTNIKDSIPTKDLEAVGCGTCESLEGMGEHGPSLMVTYLYFSRNVDFFLLHRLLLLDT